MPDLFIDGCWTAGSSGETSPVVAPFDGRTLTHVDVAPVAGTDILDEQNTQIGMITSSCASPMLGNVPIAMGYVKRAFSETGRVVDVLAQRRQRPGHRR